MPSPLFFSLSLSPLLSSPLLSSTLHPSLMWSQLVKGGDKAKFLLDDVKSYTYLNQSGCYSLTDIDDSKSFEYLHMAMTVLNIGLPSFFFFPLVLL